MEAQASKSPHTLFWIAGIAVTVFSVVGIAAVMGWIPTSTGSPAESVMLSKQPAAPAKAAAVPAKTQAQIQAEARAREQGRDQARADAREQRRDRAQVAQARCAECGVVESIRTVEARGEGSGLGAVGGAVVGGVLGNQVGSGSGNKIATVVGAVGGAVAGNEIEKRVKAGKTYEITIRLEDGSSRVINEATAPAWRTGDRVKIINGAIQSNA